MGSLNFTQGGPWHCVRAFHTNNRVASATTISLHKAVPGNACVRTTQITGWPLQSNDNDFSTQGGPWQCVRAFHTNNRVVSAVNRRRFLYTWRSLAMCACVPHKQQGRLCSRPTTISLHKAVSGNACVRSTQITGSSLQSTDNDFSPHGGPWQCVRAFHTNNRVTSAVNRPCYLCGTHA